jgi:hypothetical protein
MKIKAVRKAKAEAEEFIRRAKVVIEEYGDNDCEFIWGSHASGALRRQSMELTKALAETRKP